MKEKACNENKKKDFKSILFFIAAGIFALSLAFLIYSNISLRSQLNEYYSMYNKQRDINDQLKAMIENNSSDSEAQPARGEKSSLPPEIRSKINGITLHENSPVTFDELSYLTVPYYNFEGQSAKGHMIVNSKIADEVLDIFEELYTQLYPIQSMELAEDFDSLRTTLLNSTEQASLGNNNTCALYYKSDEDAFSPHAYGLAIDINPKINPAEAENGSSIPQNAGKYLSNSELTDTEKWAKIEKDNSIYTLFTERGWTWGGDNGGEPFCFYKEID